MVDSLAVTIEADGDSEEITLPSGLLDRLSEPGDAPAAVVADVVVMSFAGRAHALVHHAEGDPDEELLALEADAMDRFEDRFGVSYEEATGHSH